MKRWQLELMGVLLLADSLTFFHFPGFHFGGIEGFLLAPILWLVGRQIIARTVSERKPLKAAVRFVIAIFAAFGYLIVINVTQDMVAIPGPLFEVGRVSFFTVSCLLMYWLEDAYALLQGQWRVLFATLALTGLRAGEAFGLYVEDLDLEAGTITVRRSVWNGEEVTPKTKSGYRVVHIDPVLSDLLREHLNSRRGGRLFQTRTGTPLSKGNVRRKLHETLRALGIPLGGLHAFRHGRVSVLQTKGVPGDLTKEWVGHSNLRTTSRYTHFTDEYKRKMAHSLGLGMEEKLPDGPHGPPFQDLKGFSGSS